jgi:oligopeptide transport system permease protein
MVDGADEKSVTPGGDSLWRDAWRRLLKNRAAVAGGIVVLLMATMAALYNPISRWGTRYTLAETHLCLRHQPPGARGVPRVHHLLFDLDTYTLESVDGDRSGDVDARELSRTVQRIEFAHLDRDGDGVLSGEELAKAPRSFLTDDRAALLARFDTDGSGAVDLDESVSFTDIFPPSEAGQFVRTHDGDGDGALDAAEFPGVPKPRVFLLGTDGLGRDLATRMVFGAAISLLVGLLATLVSFIIGVTWGATAGYFGGRVDTVMMRIVDIIYGLPFMFLVILLMVVFGREFILMFVAIGAVTWLTMARIVRGQVISLKNQEFVQAARSIGTPPFQIVFRHLIPNALGPIIVYATLTVPSVMLQEAFLSFLGLGVQAPQTSWGALASEGASPGIMTNYPWLILAPGIALAVTLLALNFLGDGLRDALDPRMRKD